MEVKDFLSFDVKKVPTEILKAIFHASRMELEQRRAVKSVAGSDHRHHATKVYKKMPNEKYLHNHHHLDFLGDLMAQDWSHLFAGSSERKFYVYAHFTPGTKKINYSSDDFSIEIPGMPFYIGKGCGQRAFDLKRNEGHGVELSQLTSAGLGPSDLVQVLISDLTEPEALEIESKLIYFFGTKFEKHRRGLLANLDIPARPAQSK